jgi:hypothetical protein
MEVNTEPRGGCEGSSVTMNPKEVETFCIKEGLTLSSLASEIDFGDLCEARYFFQFMRWDENAFEKNPKEFRDSLYVFSEGRADVLRWLLDRGLAHMEKPYQPITIVLKTLEEAQAMWHRLNCADVKFSEAYSPEGIAFDPSTQNRLRPIWDKIDSALIEGGTSCR